MKCTSFFAAVVLFAALTVTTLGTNSDEADCLTLLSWDKVVEILRKQGLTGGVLFSVTRNSAGTMLFIVYQKPASAEVATNSDWQTKVATITANTLRVDSIQAPAAGFDDSGRVVCMVEGNALVFQTGKKIPLNMYNKWSFAPGGRIFLLDQDGKGASLFRTSEPDKLILSLDPNFVPQDIFECDDGKIFVFGQTSHRIDPKAGARGFLISRAGSEFKIDKSIDLSWMGGVIDMSGNGDMVLLESKSDLFPTWTLYDLNTKKRNRMGRAKGYGLFLDKSLRDQFK